MTPSNNPKYEPMLIPISDPGAYLYQAPHQLQILVDRQLVVIFCLENTGATGVVLFNPERSIKDLLSELEILHLKIKSKLTLKTNQITIKLFGLSAGPRNLLSAIEQWSTSIGIKIIVVEVGQRTIQNILVDCGTARVGVSYGKSKDFGKLIFVSEGTARTRTPLSEVHNNILILTNNAIQRQLTRAAIEEYPAWSAISVDNISKFIQSKPWEKNSWSVILCFADLEKQEGLDKFLKNIRQFRSSTQIRWVGSRLPDYSREIPELKLLPPMTYELLPDFKKMLKTAVFEAALAMNLEPIKITSKKRS